METIRTNFKLSALWLFILLNIIFRDIHQYAMKSHLEMLLTGVYNGRVVTEQLMLLGGFLVEIPIAMFLFSLLLKRPLNRVLNIVTAALTVGLLMAEPPSDMDDMFFKVIEFTAIIDIAWTAWKWRSYGVITA
ncbi:MAG: DUF6326 family protein [Bacteroidota bacterium]